METKQQFLLRHSDFNKNSRIWIYQANRTISDNEISTIEEELKPFVKTWAHHGQNLKASYAILYKLFVVFVVDETNAEVGGCGIDSSVHLIQKISSELNIEFFDRLAIAFFNENNEVECYLKNKFSELVQLESFNENTLVFNNQVKTIEEIDLNWIISFKESWHNNFFSKSDNFNLIL